MERVLILFSAAEPKDGSELILSAMAQAAAPQRLTFGAAVTSDVIPADLPHADRLRCALAPNAWISRSQLWRGEQVLLFAHPDLRFTRHWDLRLLRLMRNLGQNVALTGIPCAPRDECDAPRPVAFHSFDDEGRIVRQAGAPLRYATAPIPSALINESFCCGFAPFFHVFSQAELPLFLQAFAAEKKLYTLHRAIFWEEAHPSLPPIGFSRADDALTESFRKSFMTDLQNRRLSAMSRTGLFTPDLDYPRHVPLSIRLQEKLRGMRLSSTDTPLPVTVLTKAGLDPDLLPEESLRHFGLLCGVKAFPLLCFADGGMIRRALPLTGNVLEWKEKYLLPQTEGYPLPERIALSKIRMLAHAQEKMLHHSHYLWIDPTYRDAPIAPRASIDWRQLCGEKIVIATVDGRVDTGLISVPAPLLLPLGQEIEQLLSADAPMTEQRLWQRLLRDHAKLFEPRAMPALSRLLGTALTPRGVEWHTIG